MTQRERVIATVLGRKTDFIPFLMPFGPWAETLERWKTEGYDGADFNQLIGADTVFVPVGGVNLGLCPAFTPRVLEERGDKRLVVDDKGVTQLVTLDHDTIPAYLDYPVKDREDWERIKFRFAPDAPGRIAPEGPRVPAGDYVVQLGWYPYGLFGTARDLMGVERLLLTFYDDPDLIEDIMTTLTDLWLAVYEQVCRTVRVDCIHMWEDMSGCHGPLISPAMIDAFMAPQYKRIRRFCDAHNIPIFSLDTDGDCSRLLPSLIEAGVNLVYPFEVAAGSDLAAIKRQYPTQFCAMGGIDKREVAKGREAIDRELERIRPALDYPAVIPALDHLFHPEISFSDFLYFNERLKALCHGEL